MRLLLVVAILTGLSLPVGMAVDAVCDSDGRAEFCVTPSRDRWIGQGSPPRFEMTFTNAGDAWLVLPNAHPWTVFDDHGHIVAGPITAAVLHGVPPGGSLTSTWEGDAYESPEQAAAHGDLVWLATIQAMQAPPGTYAIQWAYYHDSFELSELAIEVEVEGGLVDAGP